MLYGGKHAYYRALKAFYNWLYSPKSGVGLKREDNPMLLIDAPKVEKRVLPSLNPEQINYLINQAEYVRDKAIISLFALLIQDSAFQNLLILAPKT